MNNIYRKLKVILQPSQFQTALFLFFLMIIGMILEMIGIGMVVPLLTLITEPDFILEYPALKTLVQSIGNPQPIYLVAYGMLLLLFIYILKVSFLSFFVWKQADFVFGLNKTLSQNLFNNYLNQPYIFHIQRNSAQLIRNVTVEVSQFTTAVTAASVMVAELLVFVGVLILLLIAEPIGAGLVVISLFLVGVIFYQNTRHVIFRWGESRQHHEGKRIQYLQQGFGGIKDLKVLGREDEFSNQYTHHVSATSALGKRMNVMQALPRLALELMAIIGLTVLVMSMLFQGKPLETLVPTLGLFTAAAFRLMPSVNRFLIAVQTVRFNLPVIDVLYSERKFLIKNLSQKRSKPMRFDNILELNNVNYSYQDSRNLALNNVNAKIKKGSIISFIGGSGSGKSTLIDVILGLLAPTNGEVLVDGSDIKTNQRGWQDQVGYVPQNIYLTDDTIKHNIAFGISESEVDEKSVNNAINSVQLADFISELPEGLDTIVGERGIRLSGGQLQRIGIARALYHNPKLLVLDEATSALDLNTEKEVMRSILNLRGEKTVIIVTHRLTSVECSDWIYKMDRGQIIMAGFPRDVLNINGTY